MTPITPHSASINVTGDVYEADGVGFELTGAREDPT